ncbi:MAG: maleylpyruvate isomerase family mycothiol-dependent enzyme [Ilumatobacteraceae bacterium]
MVDLEIDDYIEAVRIEGRKLLVAATSAGLNTQVPSCPEWNVRDLVRHVGGVHQWAARQVGHRKTDEITGDLVDIVGGWPPDNELLFWAAEQHTTLVRIFEGADRSFPFWTWFPGTTPFTMWTRRQAHETSIHRVDAELAVGIVSTFAPNFAADGVDELLFAMLRNRRKSLSVNATQTLHLHATDISRTWTIVMSPDGFEMYSNKYVGGDCKVGGSAAAIYRTVWHRGMDDAEVEGDRTVLEAWWENVKPAWS